MNLYKRIGMGILTLSIMMMYGYILAEVGFNAGSIILAPILSAIALFPYVYPETLMTHKYANEKYGYYIQAIRNVERRKKLNSEF